MIRSDADGLWWFGVPIDFPGAKAEAMRKQHGSNTDATLRG